MEKTLLLTIVLLAAKLSRADLVIHQRGIGFGATNNVTVSLQGNMMREDIVSAQIGRFSEIENMSTLDQTILMPNKKTFIKTSGVKIMGFLKQQEENSKDTNVLSLAKSEPKATGKSERFHGFDAEIYFWTNGKNITNKLWVAKGYPNFEAIKPYLIKFDEFHQKGLDKEMEPSVSELPGMVVKKEEIIDGQKGVVELIDAKVQSVDASLFTIPNDYTEMKQNN